MLRAGLCQTSRSSGGSGLRLSQRARQLGPKQRHLHDSCRFSTVFSTGVENFGDRPKAHGGWSSKDRQDRRRTPTL